MVDSLQMRTLEFHEYMGSQVWKDISHRFFEEYSIRIYDHIKTMFKVEEGIGQGITFAPKDFRALTRAILGTGQFLHDDRGSLIHRAAAFFTDGEGYREAGPVSLHVAIAEERCNIHIDDYGFIGEDENGNKFVNAELFQHIGDDLGMGFLREFFNPRWRPAGWALEHTHLTLPNALNGYKKEVGFQFDLARGKSNNSEKRWKLSFDLGLACNDRWCRDRAKYAGFNLTIGRLPSNTTNTSVPSPRDLYGGDGR